MVNRVHANERYRWISEQCEVLKNLKVASRGDKLGVVNDRFAISEGGFAQPFYRTYLNWMKKSYNRDAVVAHFEKLMSNVSGFAHDLKEQRISLNPEQGIEVAKNLHLIQRTLGEVVQSYRPIFSPVSPNDKTIEKLQKIQEKVGRKSRRLNERLGCRESDLIEKERNLAFQERRELARNHVVTTVERIAFVVLKIWGIFTISLLILPSFAKVQIWDRIECRLKGKVTTQTPFSWFYTNIQRVMQAHKEKVKLFDKYTLSLLDEREITLEHVQAFGELAPHTRIEKIDLSEEREVKTAECRVPMPGAAHSIRTDTLLELIKVAKKISTCKQFFIPIDLEIARFTEARFPEDFRIFKRVEDALVQAGFRFSAEKAKYVRA
jgi:hypothetical protein